MHSTLLLLQVPQKWYLVCGCIIVIVQNFPNCTCIPYSFFGSYCPRRHLSRCKYSSKNHRSQPISMSDSWNNQQTQLVWHLIISTTCYYRASQVTQMVKNLPAMQETQFNPWVGRIPWRRKWQPTLVFLPEEFHGPKEPGELQSMDRKQSDTSQCLTLSFSSVIKWNQIIIF